MEFVRAGAVVLVIVSSAFCLAAKPKPATFWGTLAQADAITAFGIDYSHAEFIGEDGFRQPHNIFPGHIKDWSQSLETDGILALVADRLGLAIYWEPQVVAAANAGANAHSIVPMATRKPGLSLSTIRASIAAYPDLGDTTQIGLVVMADRLSHTADEGCFHWVFFDVPSRVVLDAPRACMPTGGYGFRARWLRPLKDAAARLQRVKREWRAHEKAARRGDILKQDLTRDVDLQ